jgi:transcriptional regulator of met regulon
MEKILDLVLSKRQIINFILFCMIINTGYSQSNLISNGSFEEVKDGMPTNWRGEIKDCLVEDAYNGKRCLKLSSKKNTWIGFYQLVELNGEDIKKITVSAFVKVKDVIKGENEWNMARILVLFFDKENKQVGGWPELGRWQGSFDWVKKEKIFNVPKEASKCEILIELSNCIGTMWVDEVKLIIGKQKRDYDSYNLLVNGGFEYGEDIPEDWSFSGSDNYGLVSPGKDSEQCFFLERSEPGYSFLSQTIVLDGKQVKKITVSSNYKIKDVKQGEKDWEKARMHIEFLDNNKERLTGWQVVGDRVGTTSDWRNWSKDFIVPSDTCYLRVSAGLQNTIGKMWIDNINVTGINYNGEKLKRIDTGSTDTSNWFTFTYEDDDFKPNIIDLSFLLDPPAGKHGFIKVKDGKFVFEDDTSVKFWGTNIVGSNIFIAHEESERLAKRLAKLGCNLVRFHHMDAYWTRPNIFGNNPKTTRKLSEESLDKLDYLVYQLINAGIYIYMDLLVHRKILADDGIADWKNLPNGLKGVAHFDKDLIQLQKEYAKQLLTHYNPYTKRKYIDEPAIIGSEVINESSLYYSDRQKDLPETYRIKLDELFNNWLKKKYGSHENLVKSWEKLGAIDLRPTENLNEGNIRRAKINIDWNKWLDNATTPDSAGRFADTKLFYYELQYNHYKEIYDYLRLIGYKGLITGSNHWESFDGDILSNAKFDYIDRHSYFDHPDTSRGWDPAVVTFKNTSVLMTLHNNITTLANCRVAGLPFTVTEWNIPYPNEYRIIGPIMMAAYASLQNWDCVLQFDFGKNRWNEKIDNLFDISQLPTVLAQWIPAATLFHKGYVKPALNRIVEECDTRDIFYDKEHSFKIIGNDIALPLISQVEKKYVENKSSRVSDISLIKKYHNLEEKEIVSDTNELKWNYKKGVLSINTPYLQGVVGNFSNERVILNNIDVETSTPFCSITITSMDGKPLNFSKKMVLVAVGREMNSDMEYNVSRTALRDDGVSPIILENVEAKILFKGIEDVKVYPLDINGKRKGEEIKIKGNLLQISGKYKALYYEIVQYK